MCSYIDYNDHIDYGYCMINYTGINIGNVDDYLSATTPVNIRVITIVHDTSVVAMGAGAELCWG